MYSWAELGYSDPSLAEEDVTKVDKLSDKEMQRLGRERALDCIRLAEQVRMLGSASKVLFADEEKYNLDFVEGAYRDLMFLAVRLLAKADELYP